MEFHHPGSKIAVAGVHRLDVIMRIRGKDVPARSRHLELVSALEGIADESGSAVQTRTQLFSSLPSITALTEALLWSLRTAPTSWPCLSTAKSTPTWSSLLADFEQPPLCLDLRFTGTEPLKERGKYISSHAGTQVLRKKSMDSCMIWRRLPLQKIHKFDVAVM